MAQRAGSVPSVTVKELVLSFEKGHRSVVTVYYAPMKAWVGVGAPCRSFSTPTLEKA